MRFLFILSFFQFFNSAASADPIIVRAGEHNGFTRVVIDVGEPVEWEATHFADEIEIKIVRLDRSYDTTTVYDRISRDRITSIVSIAHALKLTTNCDCKVSAYNSPPGLIVLDVASQGTNLRTSLIKKNTSKQSTDQQIDQSVYPIHKQDSGNFPSIKNNTLAVEFRTKLASNIGNLSTLGILEPKAQKIPKIAHGDVNLGAQKPNLAVRSEIPNNRISSNRSEEKSSDWKIQDP